MVVVVKSSDENAETRRLFVDPALEAVMAQTLNLFCPDQGRISWQ
jgi:hypothetical protein